MAKDDVDDLLARWQRRESKYRELADEALTAEAVDRELVLALVGARAKADRGMNDYLTACLRVREK